MNALWRGISKSIFEVSTGVEPEISGGENAGDGLEILGWNVQDVDLCCGLAPQRKSALRSFRCREAADPCESDAAPKHTRKTRKV